MLAMPPTLSSCRQRYKSAEVGQRPAAPQRSPAREARGLRNAAVGRGSRALAARHGGVRRAPADARRRGQARAVAPRLARRRRDRLDHGARGHHAVPRLQPPEAHRVPYAPRRRRAVVASDPLPPPQARARRPQAPEGVRLLLQPAHGAAVAHRRAAPPEEAQVLREQHRDAAGGARQVQPARGAHLLREQARRAAALRRQHAQAPHAARAPPGVSLSRRFRGTLFSRRRRTTRSR